jgi:hypothetical protein
MAWHVDIYSNCVDLDSNSCYNCYTLLNNRRLTMQTVHKIFKKKLKDGTYNYWLHSYTNGKRDPSATCVYDYEEARRLTDYANQMEANKKT